CVAPHKAEDAAYDHLITPIKLPPTNPDKNEHFQRGKLGRNFNSASGIMSISTLYQDALKNYGNIVLNFEEHASSLAPTLPDHSVGIKDEYGRLRIWGEQTRAVLPEKARYSLDEQLRENEQTRDIILRTLRRLTNRIETVNDQLNVLRIRSSQNPDQLAQFGDYEDASSSDESLSTQSSALEAPKSRLCKAMESVFDSIRSLYHISALLKRPRNANKYLRSRNMMMPSQATLRAEEDYAHILEKMRQWRHLTMRLQVGGDEERAVTLEDIISRERDEDHELADITFLCQRLTWANKLRRSQFKYWEESPDVLETQQQDDIKSPSISKRVKAKSSSATQASFSSVAVSALAETRTEAGRLRTEYTNSVAGRNNAVRVPDVPDSSKTNPDFECPFCHLMLNSNRMQDRATWKRHVFRDLRPYVCSFESCLDPGRLFITRYDWIYHEQQMHRRKWICPEDCPEKIQSRAALIEHIRTDHSNTLNEHQFSVYADMCEREIDATELDRCLICLKEMTLFGLQRHLATHMEDIALFVLPYQPQDDENGPNSGDSTDESVLDLEGRPANEEARHKELGAFAIEAKYKRLEQGLDPLSGVVEESMDKSALVLNDDKRKVENEKVIKEAKAAHEELLVKAKAAADAAEAAKKAAEAERDANKPGPDADKAPIKFTDAVGRKFTLPWHLVKTWKGMEGLIKQALVHIEHIGPHVADGHYHLLGPNNEIILPQVWEAVVQPGWDIKMELWPLPKSDKPTTLLDPPDLDIRVDGGDSGGDGREKDSLGSSKKRGVPAFTKWMLGGTRPRPKLAQKEKEHETTSPEGFTDDEYSEVEPEGEANLPDIIASPHTAGAREPDRRWHIGSDAKSIGKRAPAGSNPTLQPDQQAAHSPSYLAEFDPKDEFASTRTNAEDSKEITAPEAVTEENVQTNLILKQYDPDVASATPRGGRRRYGSEDSIPVNDADLESEIDRTFDTKGFDGAGDKVHGSKPVRGILKKPTQRFPEDVGQVQADEASMNKAVRNEPPSTRDGIPAGARWTKIDRRLINPEALEEAHERFEERREHVVVLRVLTKEEIRQLADRTSEIREARYRKQDQ
ncbi:hypothetical protein D6D01_10155, partial [Aureobasidium pullulans]